MDRMKRRWSVAFALGLAVLAGVAVSGASPDLEGTWAMLQVYPRIAVLPLVGESSQTSYVIQWLAPDRSKSHHR